MKKNNYELDRLKAEIDNAQRQVDAAKSRLDSISSRRNPIKSQMESVKYRISDLRSSINNEYQMMKYCYQSKDRISAENHKYNAQSFTNSIQDAKAERASLYNQLDGLKSEYDYALSTLRDAKERKRQAIEIFKRKLEEVKAQNQAERDKWKEKNCRICGATIRYHVEWNRIPDLCKPCQDREKSKWHETRCKKCGNPIRYHEDWAHVPSLCKQCKSN